MVGIDSPSDLDWLGIYSPPSSAHDNFIGYVFLSSCPTWESGSGSISLPLVNLRANYSFRIFRWSRSEVDPTRMDHDHNPLPGTTHLVAESGEVGFGGGGGPEQIHLAYTDREDEMRVMFVTGDAGVRTVRYGLSRDAMHRVVTAAVGRYEREDMCDSPANESVGWRDPGFIQDAVMRNLKKGKRYYYKVGSDSGGWSAIHNFMSRDMDSEKTIAFLFGDMGTATPYSTFLRTQEESKSTVKWILRDIEALDDNPAFISHIGDISYARGYSWLWDNFFTQVEPIASRLPYHVCIGNHEYDWPLQPWKPDWSSTVYGTDGGGECGVPYSLKFKMPGNSSELTGTRAPATRNLFYSFDTKAVHFVYISTETNFLPGSSQYDFIKQDLESVDRKKTPFVVVQGHRPMYTTSNELRDAPVRERMLKYLEPLFVKNNVTLALWGHVHRYERFCPINNFTCGNMGLNGEYLGGLPVHIVIGMAGQDWQPTWEPRPDHPKDPVYPQPKWSLYRGGEFGYTRFWHLDKFLSGVGEDDAQPRVEVAEYTFSWYVKGASILVLGAFMGYVIGFVSHARREAALRKNWTPVKIEDS
ncbi:putative inactive purple acid phosphatase 2 [Vitis vinifera]|uniref:Purple acid phosphatase n=1 Tax=Vitis vinifera TaxID=29760 RepID=A0A438J0W2_VITVI|nr:putative inactive purple acid phosphatase 2 [Vitis vinifera]